MDSSESLLSHRQEEKQEASLPLPAAFLEFLSENGLDPMLYSMADTIPRYIRLKPGMESQITEIESELKCDLKKVSWLPDFYAIPPEVRISGSEAYRQGKIYGIDAASGAAILALDVQPGDHVLDLCAAPGAKLCMLADMLGSIGSLTGVDVAKHRLAACRTMLQKYSLGDRSRLFVADGTSFSILPVNSCLRSMEAVTGSIDHEDNGSTFSEWTSRRSWKDRQQSKKAKAVWKGQRSGCLGSTLAIMKKSSKFLPPEEEVEMINNWVKNSTDNLIDSISRGDITAATDLVLANVVYFKGAWLKPFFSLHTSPGTFHRLDGSRVKAQFMSKLDDSQYVSCMDGFKVLKLPYKQGHAQEGAGQSPLKRHRGQGAVAKTSQDADDTQYSMFVFLPDKRGGIATMVDVITAAPGYLYSVLPKAMAKHVSLKLPKFEINFDRDLKSDLRRLGLSLPFSPEVADLRGMCGNDDDDGRPTFLSKVAHRAVVKVNEAGTEATAVFTGLRGGGGPPPDMVEFVADHPFTFFIMEERSGVIVFAGHVLDPTK